MSVLIHDARFAPGKDPSGCAARSHGAIGASSLVCLVHLGVLGKAGAASVTSTTEERLSIYDLLNIATTSTTA